MKFSSVPPFSILTAIIGLGFLALLSGCVTAPDGSRKFNPWGAAKQADENMNAWLDRQGNVTTRPAMWEE
jgi:hypothetical protein